MELTYKYCLMVPVQVHFNIFKYMKYHIQSACRKTTSTRLKIARLDLTTKDWSLSLYGIYLYMSVIWICQYYGSHFAWWDLILILLLWCCLCPLTCGSLPAVVRLHCTHGSVVCLFVCVCWSQPSPALKWLAEPVKMLGQIPPTVSGSLGASSGPLWGIRNTWHEPKLFARRQQWCGLSLSVL